MTSLVLATVLCGFVLRMLYVGMADVEYPIRGDINQYVLYAWNLTHRGTFSTDLPGAPHARPDSYRGPGYPLLLAVSMLAAGNADLPLRAEPGGSAVLGFRSDTWMRIALGIQVMLGLLAIVLTMAIARLWLGERWVLLAGSLVAVWPHLVAFTGVLLSETLFAAMLLLSTWLYCSALAQARRTRMTLAGLSWGVTYLVNPIVALFPALAAALCVTRKHRELALVLLVAFVPLPAAWAVRNFISVSDAGAIWRLEENFVQGSWPQYHAARSSRDDDAISRQIIDAIDAETAETKAAPAKGLASVGERFAQDPEFYLAWYLLEKPYLLWDWSIRVGAGDIYFLRTEHSPFVVIPLLAGLERLCRWLNPGLFALATLAALGAPILVLLRRGPPMPASLLTVALLTLYLTFVHVVLQAEPRYSIPYRPLEILLAVTAASFVTGRAGRSVKAWREAASGAPTARPG